MGTGKLDWLFGPLGQKEDLIDKVSIRREQDYQRVSIDLTTARTKEKIYLSGIKIEVGSYDGSIDGCCFSLNSPHAGVIYPSEIQSITSPYKWLYLTNTAQSGKTLVLYVSFNIDAVEGIRGAIQQDSRFTAHTFKASTKTSADAAAPLTASSDKYRNVVVTIDDYDAYIGDATSQPVYLTKGTPVTLDFVDLAEVYIKNAVSGDNAVANWIGMSEK